MKLTHLLLVLLALAACKKDNDESAAAAANNSTTTTADLTAPSLITPPMGASGIWTPIMFSWQAVEDADAYEARSWYYTTSGNMANFILSMPFVYTTSYTPNATLTTANGWGGQTIYWHVRALRGSPGSWELGPWSTTYSFTLAN